MPFILFSEFSHKGNPELAGFLKKHHFGRMWGRDYVNRLESELWGFDNGAWSSFSKGTPWDEQKFLKRLTQAQKQWTPHTCIVAAVPDIVQGGNESLRFSLDWIERLNETACEFPWFLVVQDGMDSRAVKHNIHKFRGLFLGGSDKFKKSAPYWCDVAHYHNKLFHWGRCGSINALRAAIRIDTDSLDSSRPVKAYIGGEIHRARKWINVARGWDDQKELEFVNK